MEASFWHQKWERGDIGFHESEVNPFLIEHLEELNLTRGNRIFLPLCGKTRDVAWLLACGYRVVGAELSELAINELFKELGLEPEISKVGKLARYRAEDIDILAGDICCVCWISWAHKRDIRSRCFGCSACLHTRTLYVTPDEHNRYCAAVADYL
jgi:thiopurine S-methyltransferase